MTSSPAANAPLLVRAVRGEAVERVPVWLMRQAGRYMTEYRQLREKHAFMEVVKAPDLAMEVSLQPWRAFRPDGVILFSDILTPLAGMGIPFTLDERGPRITSPVNTRAAAEKVAVADPADSVPFVLETLRRLKREIAGQAALLGFAGAPFTLATYAAGEGRHAKESGVKTLAYHDPGTLHLLLEKLARQAAAYLAAQVEAGADVVQLFDTWAGELAPDDYRRLALPYQQQAIAGVRGRAPVILYVLGGGVYPDLLAESGADVISVDWRLPLGAARAALRPGQTLQGNLDPAVLLGPAELVRERTLAVLAAGEGRGHVFNLGHGLLPSTPRENVGLVIDTVKAWRR